MPPNTFLDINSLVSSFVLPRNGRRKSLGFAACRNARALRVAPLRMEEEGVTKRGGGERGGRGGIVVISGSSSSSSSSSRPASTFFSESNTDRERSSAREVLRIQYRGSVRGGLAPEGG